MTVDSVTLLFLVATAPDEIGELLSQFNAFLRTLVNRLGDFAQIPSKPADSALWLTCSFDHSDEFGYRKDLWKEIGRKSPDDPIGPYVGVLQN